jgi:hypothetical protein
MMRLVTTDQFDPNPEPVLTVRPFMIGSALPVLAAPTKLNRFVLDNVLRLPVFGARFV